ncbi:MAG: monovalent cation/H+ antiporter subunit D family protein, partial [Betaproteobacteria bacterium]|nr:monovalent cation/H+ antiporter subunit D family protein [Betaproteobacteria bacterium]
FGQTLVFDRLPFGDVLLFLSVAAIVTASLVAVFQPDLKRMLAYSSVGQIGYITLGISLANAPGLTGAIAHLFNHALAKGALFLLAGGIALRYGGTSFWQIAGLAARMPLTSFGVVLAGLSLIGIPGTAGFTTKWYLIVGAVERGYWLLAVLIVATSLIAVVYVWRFVEAAYFQAPAPEAPHPGEMPPMMLVPAWLMVAGCVYFGLETSFNIGFAGQAADLLLRRMR